MTLRQYQRDAVDAVWDHLRTHNTNPAVVLPTGSGKTHVIAEICRAAVQNWSGRVIVLAHVKELLEQAADKLGATMPGVPLGIYSAGLGRRDLGYGVTIAGIQSIYKRAESLGKVDIAIIDEAHLIPPNGEGMYRRFIAGAQAVNPNLRVVGLTATPYRMKSGMICDDDSILNKICFEVGIKELIRDGYLSPLVSKQPSEGVIQTDAVHVRAGDYIASELESESMRVGVVDAACAEIVGRTKDRSATLIFCTGIKHAENVADVLQRTHDIECGLIFGDTPKDERAAIIERFKNGGLQYLANVNVLTTGFDAPNIDCVAMLRPTMSPGLYYQMVGRGFRLNPGKADCLVLDFGGNVLRHGPVDLVRGHNHATQSGGGVAPQRVCPECQEIVLASYSECPSCGYQFPAPESKHDAEADDSSIISGDNVTSRVTFGVQSISYWLHRKRGDPDAPPTLRVEYQVGFNEVYKEWVCFEHTGYARSKAEQWWSKRSNYDCPVTVNAAVELCNGGAVCWTDTITIEDKPGDKYTRIVGYTLGDKPGVDDFVPSTNADIDLDDIPF